MPSMRSIWRKRGEKSAPTAARRTKSLARFPLERLEPRDLLAVAVAPLGLTEGFPFSGQVATFAAGDVQGSSPQVMIAWGDGHVSPGTITPLAGAGGFAVAGANTYAVPGSFPITVTVAGSMNTSATGQGLATVNTVILKATGTTVTSITNRPFAGVVASFTDAYPGLGPGAYVATIDWGDGHISTGTVTADARGGFDVFGTNTYAVAKSYPIGVSVVRSLDNQSQPAKSTAIVVAPTFTAVGVPITAIGGQPFTGTVASFTDSVPQTRPEDYRATIVWGDDQTTAGTVVADGRGGFDVIGAHVYQSSNVTRMVDVMITRVADAQAASSRGTATVTTQTNVSTGRLDPLSDTGASDADGITAVNNPTYIGTAPPYAIVTLYGRRSNQAQPVWLVQAIADINGLWHAPIGPLPDGTYVISASVTPPAGQPQPMVSLTGGSPLIVDTTPPTAPTARFDPRSGLLVLTLKDGLSGPDPSDLLDPASYALIGPGRRRVSPTSVALLPNATVRTTDATSVILQLRGVRGSRFGTIALAKIRDRAGNPVTVEHVKVSRGTIPHPGSVTTRKGGRGRI